MQKIKKKKESKSLLDFSLKRIFGERDIFFKFEAFRSTILLISRKQIRKFLRKVIRSRRTCTGTRITHDVFKKKFMKSNLPDTQYQFEKTIIFVTP